MQSRVGHRETPRLRRAFWTAYRDLAQHAPTLRCGRASSDSWMHHNGYLNGGTLFTMIRVRQGEIGVQLALDDITASTIFSYLETHRATIDSAFPKTPQWRRVGTRTHEIEVRRPADIARRDEWQGYFAWYLLQLESFQRVLWPLVGRVPYPGQSRQWDRESFFTELESHTPSAAAPARRLLEWNEHNMSLVQWGHGRRFGSFIPRARREGRLYDAISVWTSATVSLRFADLKKEWPFSDEALRLELLRRFNRVPHVSLPRKAISALPALPLPLLAESRAMTPFLDALDWFAATVRGGHR
jgi:hypothetical protein